MRKRLKKFFFNPWIIGISTGIIASWIYATITSSLNQISFWEALVLLIKTIISFIVNILCFGIPVYVILIVITILLLGLKIFRKFKKDIEPEWLSYTQDDFRGWHISWAYNKNFYDQYDISNLRPICHCGCELSGSYYSMHLTCPKCGKTYKNISQDDINDIHKIIVHNVKTGDYSAE